MRWARRLAISVVAIAVAGTMGACGDPEQADDELRDAIRATERLPFKYAYEEESGRRLVEVRGIVEDDFRYKAQVAVDGSPAYEEVVSDDVVAARLLDPDALGTFVKEELAGESAGEFEKGATALQDQQWVIDRTGAPSLLRSGGSQRRLGDDWIIDSLTVFDHLEQVMRTQPTVLFNRESLDYRENEDPFPHPRDGVRRYDIRPLDLPRRSDATGGNQQTLGERHFRKISVYVEDGVILEVREAIDVANRLDEIERNFDVTFPEDRSVAENVEVAVNGINVVRTGQGDDPLRVRTMHLRLTDLGTDVRVALPVTETVDASLAFLQNRGFGAATTDESDAGDAGDAGDSDPEAADDSDADPAGTTDGTGDPGGSEEAEPPDTGSASS